MTEKKDELTGQIIIVTLRDNGRLGDGRLADFKSDEISITASTAFLHRNVDLNYPPWRRRCLEIIEKLSILPELTGRSVARVRTYNGDYWPFISAGPIVRVRLAADINAIKSAFDNAREEFESVGVKPPLIRESYPLQVTNHIRHLLHLGHRTSEQELANKHSPTRLSKDKAHHRVAVGPQHSLNQTHQRRSATGAPLSNDTEPKRHHHSRGPKLCLVRKPHA